MLFNRQQDQLYTSLTKLATGNGEDSVSNSMTVAHRYSCSVTLRIKYYNTSTLTSKFFYDMIHTIVLYRIVKVCFPTKIIHSALQFLHGDLAT